MIEDYWTEEMENRLYQMLIPEMSLARLMSKGRQKKINKGYIVILLLVAYGDFQII